MPCSILQTWVISRQKTSRVKCFILTEGRKSPLVIQLLIHVRSWRTSDSQKIPGWLQLTSSRVRFDADIHPLPISRKRECISRLIIPYPKRIKLTCSFIIPVWHHIPMLPNGLYGMHWRLRRSPDTDAKKYYEHSLQTKYARYSNSGTWRTWLSSRLSLRFPVGWGLFCIACTLSFDPQIFVNLRTLFLRMDLVIFDLHINYHLYTN